MADIISTSGITGSDGKTPVYEPNGRWTQWSLKQIYLGAEAANKYVPKVDDYVVDTDTDEKYRVVSLDPTTLIPELAKVQQVSTSGIFDETDLLLGVGPGTQSDTYRVYIDRSKVPHVMAVDARLRFYGKLATSCKIYKGSFLQGNADVISALYDANGTLLSQAIPLELVAVPSDTLNRSIKSVPVCYTTEELEDNDIVTVVAYSDTGSVVSKRQLLVENTAYIRSSNDAVKYIVGIELESPFLSVADPKLLEFPINVPLNGLNMIGVVNYSDGSQLRLPVDNTKFELFGAQNYVSTIVGQQLPLVLKYNLSSDEKAVDVTVAAAGFLSETYKGKTLTRDGIYSVKLFGYPTWIDSVNGYRLEWYLYNLDRDVVYHVTPYVSVNTNTRAFDPLAYGISQRLSVSINLQRANPAYKSLVHTQTIDIVLAQPGNTHADTAWTIGFEPGQNPPFGRFNSAAMTFVNQNLRKINLAMGEATQASWLLRVYNLSKPLVDQQTESLPPDPTHFALDIGNTLVEFPISQWNQDLAISQQINDSSTLFVRFFRRTPQTDLQLAVVGLPVWQTN